MDWERDLLSFPLYHEGDKPRNLHPIQCSETPTLSIRVLQSGAPLYVPTVEEGERLGAHLTTAEKATGLIPATWFGVPFGMGERPSGLVSYQGFQADAFSEDRRMVMTALAALFGTAMASSKGLAD
jgi:hypothetical protein